jgi:hypothetical protein
MQHARQLRQVDQALIAVHPRYRSFKKRASYNCSSQSFGTFGVNIDKSMCTIATVQAINRAPHYAQADPKRNDDENPGSLDLVLRPLACEMPSFLWALTRSRTSSLARRRCRSTMTPAPAQLCTPTKQSPHHTRVHISTSRFDCALT